MSEMIERVAKILAESHNLIWEEMAETVEGGWDDETRDRHRFMARSVIEAMREPTSEMIAEGHRHDPLSCDVGEDQVEYCYGTMWRAMIDAALNEKNPATP